MAATEQVPADLQVSIALPTFGPPTTGPGPLPPKFEAR